MRKILLCINFYTTQIRTSSFFLFLKVKLSMKLQRKSVFSATPVSYLSLKRPTWTFPILIIPSLPLPLPLTLPPPPGPAVSLTEGDYTKALTWATQRQISSVCQHDAISIPASDKWPRQKFFLASFPGFTAAPSGSPLPDCQGKGLLNGKSS